MLVGMGAVYLAAAFGALLAPPLRRMGAAEDRQGEPLGARTAVRRS